MPHQLAKLLLEQAGSLMSRKDAIEKAIAMGMPLDEARDYLDWLDMVRQQTAEDAADPDDDAAEKRAES